MRFIQIEGGYINIDHIVSIEKLSGHYRTVIRLSNGKDICTKKQVGYVAYLIRTTDKERKEVSR